MISQILFLAFFAFLGIAIAVAVLGVVFPKYFGHDILGWVKPDETVRAEFDGVNVKCVCKYCGKKCIQDSTGDWFHTD